ARMGCCRRMRSCARCGTPRVRLWQIRTCPIKQSGSFWDVCMAFRNPWPPPSLMMWRPAVWPDQRLDLAPRGGTHVMAQHGRVQPTDRELSRYDLWAFVNFLIGVAALGIYMADPASRAPAGLLAVVLISSSVAHGSHRVISSRQQAAVVERLDGLA